MIVDFCCHPPTPPFRTYFNPERLAPLAKRLGVREMAPQRPGTDVVAQLQIELRRVPTIQTS